MEVNRTTEQYGYDVEFVGYDVVGVPLDEERPLLDAAIRNLELACQPLPDSVVLKHLGALRVMTKSRAEEGSDLAFMLQLYAEKLRDYPADIVLHVLKTQASICKFWPAWLEIQERLDWRAKPRLKRLEALQRLRSRMVGQTFGIVPRRMD